jgi:esterase/lipase
MGEIMNDLLEVIEELKKILEFDDDMIREEVETYVSELQLKVDEFEQEMERQYEMFEKEIG